MRASVRRVARVAFGVWSAFLFSVLSTLMIGHWSTLPRVERADADVRRALDTLRAPGEERRWLLVHVLNSACRCSQRLLEHLAGSARPAGVAEKVILVGAEGEATSRLRAAGFAVELVTRRELSERFHFTAAPLLVIAAPDGSVRYLGGYTDRAQGPDIADLAILDELRRGGEARERPLFGCAVSKELQALLDPFGLKYARAE